MHKLDSSITIENVSLEVSTREFKGSNLIQNVLHFIQGPFSQMRMQQKKSIIKNLNLHINSGDRLALIGVNGAGKSTICRLISGIYEPSNGKVKIVGNVRALYESGMVLYSELTGRENARVLVSIFYPDCPELHDAIITDSILFSELGDSIDQPMKIYSNGMIVRLTMSILSARPADILILDEVFDGADEYFRAKINQRVRALINQSGIVIFVSHYRELVKEICNRAILIVDGKVVFDGSIDETYQQYSVKK